MQEKIEKKSNFFERIEEIIDYYEIKNVNIFSKKYLEYASSEKINRLKKENASPSFDILNDISNKFERISVRWLVTGKGEMIEKSKVVEPQSSDSNDTISFFYKKNEELIRENERLKAEIEKLKSENEGLKISARKKPADLVDFGLETEKKEAEIA